jgi:urea transport system permease protein
VAAYLGCRWITLTRAGKVLIAIRDSETRVLFSGYSPAAYKLFVFVVSAVLAGVAGALYAPQVGIITPAKIGVLPSIEMVVWVAAGGRGTLIGAVVGAIGVNWIQSWLTTSYPDLWLLFLGALFMGVVLFFPDGVVGGARRLVGLLTSRPATSASAEAAPGSTPVITAGGGPVASPPVNQSVR